MQLNPPSSPTPPLPCPQELAAEESYDALPGRMGAVQAAATALRDAYYSLRLGDEAYLTLGGCWGCPRAGH